MNRLVRIAVIMVIAAIVLFGQRWYSYVTNTTDPFDEVGIELNSRMPGPLNEWGCSKLKATFAIKSLPPNGCQDATGKGWK